MEEEIDELWEGENARKVKDMLAYYRREFTGSRNEETGDDFAEGKIADVKVMSFYEDVASRANGALESKNAQVNRIVKRTVGKGGRITGESWIEAWKFLERLTHAEVQLMNEEIDVKRKKRKYTKATQRMQKIQKRFGDITAENYEIYFDAMKGNMGFCR